jgi:5'-nucleotidase
LLVLGLAATLIASQVSPATETITILHTNDMHGYIEPEVIRVGGKSFESGGMANLAGLVASIRAKDPIHTLILDAGDIWQGTFISNQSKGEIMVAAMNSMKYDAAAPGNHDFDFGQDVLRARADQATFPFLAANLVEESSGQPPVYVRPYMIKTLGTVRVGVIGLTYPGTPAINKPANVRGLRFLGGVEAVRTYLPEVRRQADVVIVLSHLGIDGDQQLAESVDGIDLIVGGHTHIELRNARQIRDTVIVQAGSKAKLLGKVAITLDTHTKRITAITKQNVLLNVVSTEVTPDPAVKRLVDSKVAEARVILDRPLGETLIDLEQSYEGEFPLGNLIADAMLAANQAGDRPADAAMHNNSGIRARIPKGPITYGMLYQVLPFDNVLCAIDLTGEQLMRILERTVAGRRGNLVVAGMTYQYDWTQPVGSRIVAVTIQGKPLDPMKTYRIQTIDYLCSGGDGQETFKEGRNPAFGDPVVDVVAEYIRTHSPVNPKVEGRITSR